MPLTIDNELRVVFDPKFYNEEHLLWAKFEDGRVVDASEVAERASAIAKHLISIRPADREKRSFSFYRKNEKIGELYFGKPDENHVYLTSIDDSLYSAFLEKILKAISASGKYPVIVESIGNLKRPKELVLGILDQKYLVSIENAEKGNYRRVASIEKIPQTLLEDFSMKHSKYGTLVLTVANGKRSIEKPTYEPPEHDIPLYPELCPIGFTIGFTPNLNEWLTIHYDPIGTYNIGYYVVNEKYVFERKWELQFKEKNCLGTFKLSKVNGEFEVKNWMHILLKTHVENDEELRNIVAKSFSTKDESVLSVFYIVPLKRVKKELTECEVYVYSRYWPSPKLVRLYMKTCLGEPNASLFWIKHVNLTPSMKWSKVWKHWAKPTKISIITACVLSILKEAR